VAAALGIVALASAGAAVAATRRMR